MEKTVPTLTLDEWKALHYPYVIRELSEEEGGGWIASIPMLGEAMFRWDDETAVGALTGLEELRISLYEDVIESGQPIPIPEGHGEHEDLPSGKFVIRMEPILHYRLQCAAKSKGVSLNSYCVRILQNASLSVLSGKLTGSH